GVGGALRRAAARVGGPRSAHPWRALHRDHRSEFPRRAHQEAAHRAPRSRRQRRIGGQRPSSYPGSGHAATLAPYGRPRVALDGRPLTAPAVIANIGLQGDRELGLQGQRQQLRRGEPDAPSTSLVNSGVFVEQVLRKGAREEESGPSVATEYGFLLPGIHAENGLGFSWAGIVS